MTTYTVQPGDDLSKIALAVYGANCPNTIQKIFDANRGVIGNDPGQLRPGQVLNLP